MLSRFETVNRVHTLISTGACTSNLPFAQQALHHKDVANSTRQSVVALSEFLDGDLDEEIERVRPASPDHFHVSSPLGKISSSASPPHRRLAKMSWMKPKRPLGRPSNAFRPFPWRFTARFRRMNSEAFSPFILHQKIYTPR